MTWTREHCTSPACGAPVVFARHTSGKVGPFDYEPNPAGVWLMTVGERPGQPNAQHLNGDELVEARRRGTPLYVSHYATCPDAKAFRRG